MTYKPVAKQLKNTVIPFFVESIFSQWIPEATEERKADFLVQDDRWWMETTNGVEFADITCFNEDSRSYHVSFVEKHHFRSKKYTRSHKLPSKILRRLH